MIPRKLVLAAALVWTLFVGTLAVQQRRGLRTQMHDLGNAEQALSDASRGATALVQGR